MISVCIPIYNCAVKQLVSVLYKQCRECSVDFEIIILDDASTKKQITEENETLSTNYSHVLYFENKTNQGSARVRNRLSKLAQYPYLIFIDGDSAIVRDDYIIRYLKLCSPQTAYFGGCVYSEECPSEEYILRWKFGKEREEGVGKYFSCFNFLIDRNIILAQPFSEELQQYGYEDVLFGVNLKDNYIDISFVDNSIEHIGLDKANTYIEKIHQSLENLVWIESEYNTENIYSSIKLLRVARKLKKNHLHKLVANLFCVSKSLLLKNLKGKNPSLFMLDLYKLGYFCNLKIQKK